MVSKPRQQSELPGFSEDLLNIKIINFQGISGENRQA